MKRSAIILWAGLLITAGCNFNVFRDTSTPSFVKTYQTGSETQILQACQTEPSQQADAVVAANCLDEAFEVLAKKAYPSPDPRSLSRLAVLAMCQEYRRQTGVEISSAHRETWIWTAIRSESFQQVLDGFAKRRPAIHNQKQFLAAGLRGMLRAAGARSAQLFTPEIAAAIAQAQTENQGPEPGVVGLAIDNWPAVDVLPLSPAYQAGLRDGDIVTTIDGQAVSGRESERAIDDLLAGTFGTNIRITAKRNGAQKTFTFSRASQACLAVRADVPQHDVCYIRIPSFAGSGVAKKVADLVRRAKAAKIDKIVLDLRGNSGGSLEEANAIADLFLDNRTLQTFAFQVGQRVVFLSKPGRIDAEVTILTNRATASAAEMLAMALRDNGAATIVGEDTFGALFGRRQHTLANGYVISFRADLTILSPRGDDYSVTGIYPDVAVEDRRSEQADAILARAIDQATSARPAGQPNYANLGQETTIED